jgi:RNA polymerase sigma-70 factor (ECF subfamily)
MDIDTFERYRPLLFSIAYRMVGTVTEAEDLVQEAFLRAHQAATEIEQPKAYLTTILTRLCLNHLSAAQTQRQSYLGPWLPEPILTENRPELVDPMEKSSTLDSISIAFMILLESLSPTERAVFILHEVFDYKYREIAEIIGKREAACRQLFRRAKQHVVANRPRFETDPVAHERLLQGFIEVAEAGDIEPFLQLLAEEVALVPDGGGQRGAATRIVRGREAVAAFIIGVRRLAPAKLNYEVVTLNGQQAILARTPEGRPFFTVFIYGQTGQARLLHVVAGEKLRGLA